MFLLRRIGRDLGTTLCLAALLTATHTQTQAQTPSADPPKMQLPADQRAFQAARAIVDPEPRLAAMREFVTTYPKSTRVSRAQIEILNVLLKNFPQRTPEIDAQARLLMKTSGKGLSKLYFEADIADSLADAGTHGADLPLAEKYANDAVNKLTEAGFDKDITDADKKYKQPRSTPASMHSRYATTRASALSALARVDLDENKIPQATTLLDEAYGLSPTANEVNLLRGEIALDGHRDPEALAYFERAQLTGELKSPWREKMMALYRKEHAGSDAGFTAEMDTRYAQLFPEPFTPKKHESANGSRTVLLELFTGSACEPCVSADLAVDALLQAYPRQELVALSFDQHVPEPDPLANPDSVARGTLYTIAGTPTFTLDGQKLPMGGGSREDSEEAYSAVSKRIDTEASAFSGVQLKLNAERSADGLVHAKASVTVTDPQQMQQQLASKHEASPADNEASASKPSTPPPAIAAPPPPPVEPHLVVNFALVEDDVRYSGENGMRFHRMVVRSLAQPADGGFEVGPGKDLDATFDAAQITSKLKEYLDGYELKNDRFGKVEFLSKDTTIHPAHMAVAAWVQDTTTHRVLQAAFVPLGQEPQP